MAKKQKKGIPKPAPTKRQISKWQRQMRIRRIVIIAAVVFLVGIGSWVGYEYYKDYQSDPMREVVIEVNGVPFTMEYFLNTLDIYVGNYISTTVNSYLDFYMQSYNYTRQEAIQLLTSNAISELYQNTDNIGDMITGQVAEDIIDTELMRQGAKEELGIEVTDDEIDAGLEARRWPNERAYRDIVSAALLQEKVREYFDPGLNATMEQAHVQVMLVESQEVATGLIAEINAGGNFTTLAEEFSCNSSIEGDLGWLPEELMPNTLIANAAFNLTPGKISQPIYDETAIKNIGYWLIEVTDKQDEEIKARAMLLGSEVEAKEVKAELLSGNFSSIAEEYSQHESKTKGGELDWLKLGDMGSNAFDKVAFDITANEVSEPVKDESIQTVGGHWLVRVINKGIHELEAEVKERLIDKHFNDWLEEWKENSAIENRLDEEKKTWAVTKVLEER